MIGLIISAAFQFCFMALAVDFIDRRGPSSKMCHQLQPKKTKVMFYHPFTRILQQKTFYLPFIANKTKCVSCISGCVVRVGKHLKETSS